ncbi:hypothetical protein FOMPIDRAFT_1053038 [Fomitopsis schrenkii]|uniref:DUF6534 domain-containing protein n=1 Tax=Fomitopsis schrenkii TaxID=2126942 RepID=S8DTY2_FOMSC|nr:hypothetical protein FOMPIDRAFT_1053038 [Fomitopsis schrenkii]
MASALPNLNDTLGCTFIGILFEILFYGFSCAQTQYYFHEYPKDKAYLKIFVAFLWLVDTARTALDIQYMWVFIVAGHANPAALLWVPKSFLAEFFLASLTMVVVQLYFIRSIWLFLPGIWYRWPLTITVTLLAILSFAGGTATVWKFTLDPGYAASIAAAIVTASIQTVAGFVTDVYITVCLTWILYGEADAFSSTDTLITKLVMYAIHRGVFTALLQLLHFATYIGTIQDGPNMLIWSLFHFPGSKIYVNSLLAILNVRHWLRESHWVEEVRLDSIGRLASIRCAAAERRPVGLSADGWHASLLGVPLRHSQVHGTCAPEAIEKRYRRKPGTLELHLLV